MAGRKRTRHATRASDPAEVALFSNLFIGVAEEMGVSLIRTAHSSNIKERRDCSCALFDAAGRLIAQAAHVPVHLGAMPASVTAALNHFDNLLEGDAILLNDPFAGGTHLPDLTVVTPVFASASRSSRQVRVALLASRAHHADVGGMSPGSLPLSKEIYQEGLRIPPVKLRAAGQLNDAVLKTLQANSRTPAERIADLQAQLAAHDVGALRLQDIIQRHGLSQSRRQMDRLVDYGRRVMQQFLGSLPDGVYRFEDALDGDGVGAEPLRIRVKVTINGRRAVVDFSGSAAACAGNVNAVLPVTQSATYYCFLSLLVTRTIAEGSQFDPPLNAGSFAPITIVAPSGSIVNAEAPHAVACGNLETSQRIVDVVFGALADALPEWVPAAAQGTMNNVALGGVDPRSHEPFAYYETIAGGMGASAEGPGVDGVQVHMTNTLNTPAEALEFTFPMRVQRYQIRTGSGGRGRHAGGQGLIRELCMLCDCTGTLLSDRRVGQPYGLKGGADGRCGKNVLIRNQRRRSLPGKVHLQLQAGDVLRIETPGGGGWGRRGS